MEREYTVLTNEDFNEVSCEEFNQMIDEWEGGYTVGTIEEINNDIHELEINNLYCYDICHYLRVEGTGECVILTD